MNEIESTWKANGDGMTERERLIELLKNAKLCSYPFGDQYSDSTIGKIADHLLANGVICPPCKVGDTVWCIYNYPKPKEFRISVLTMSDNHYSFVIETNCGVYKHYCDKDAVGKWVFFNKEQAEKALAERSKE